MKKRVLAMILTAMVTISACPAAVWGEEIFSSEIQVFEEEPQEVILEEGEEMPEE